MKEIYLLGHKVGYYVVVAYGGNILDLSAGVAELIRSAVTML